MNHTSVWGFSKTCLALAIAGSMSSAIAQESSNQSTNQSTNSATLQKVVVSAESLEETYTKKEASTSTKLDISVKETPQSMSVITEKQITDMGATNLGQILMFTPGVILTGDNSERTNFSIRGFNVGDGWNSNLMQYDGVPLNASNVAASKPDAALIESIEVLRGAAGLMQGSGEPSGAINIIRKKPTDYFRASGALTYGSWDMYRVEADVSDRLNDSGTVRGRAVVAYQDANSYMDAVTRDTNLVYGILAADLTENTELTLSYKRQGEHAIGAHNLPRDPRNGNDLHLSRDNCSCNFSDYWDKANADGTIDLTHTFENGWIAKGTYVRAKIEMDMVFTSLAAVPAAAFDPANPQGTVNKYAYQYVQTLDVFDGYTKGNFELFGREHQLIVGGNVQNSDIPGRWTSWDVWLEDYSLWNRTGAQPGPLLYVDLENYSPYDLPYVAPRYNLDGGQSFEDRSQSGVYATTRLHLAEPLHLILGVRQSDFSYDSPYKSNVTGQFVPSRRTSYEMDNINTPYVGLTFDINDYYTAYASFTDTFVVQNSKDINGELLDPIQGNVYEAGVKGSFNDDRLIASLAAFKIEQINRAMRDESSMGQCPQNGGDGYCNVASGEVVSEGYELEVRGEILPGFNMMFGYTYNTTEYDVDPVNAGRVFNETTPEHIARVFTTYLFDNGLTLGGGASYQSEWLVGRYGSISASQEAYTLVNLMASYPLSDNVTVTFNADNALDEEYYSYLSTSVNRYGEPRNMRIGVRATF